VEKKESTRKLLLLGTGESGKSTIFKQLITIYGKGISPQERLDYQPVIWSAIIASAKTLSEQSEKLKARGVENTTISEDLVSYKKYIDEYSGETVDAKLAEAIEYLWKDPGIQVTYENRSMYQLSDATTYFLPKVKSVVGSSYHPSEDDVLHVRARSIGIVDNTFDLDGIKFRLLDVGGQRSERKKWAKAFEGHVAAVLYVVALSEYDQLLSEDEKVNRMVESMSLFEEMVNKTEFADSVMIILFNKLDIFRDKIKKTPLSQSAAFQDYKGENTQEASSKYIIETFLSKNKKYSQRKIYSHTLCAMEKDSLRETFASIKQVVVEQVRNSLA